MFRLEPRHDVLAAPVAVKAGGSRAAPAKLVKPTTKLLAKPAGKPLQAGSAGADWEEF